MAIHASFFLRSRLGCWITTYVRLSMVDGRAPPIHWGMRPRYIFFRWLEEEEQWVVLLAVDEDVYYSQGSCDSFDRMLYALGYSLSALMVRHFFKKSELCLRR